MARDDETWQAIEQACIKDAEKFEDVEQQMMLSYYVVVAARSGVDEDGEPVTQVHILPDGAAAHVMLGLLDEAHVKFEADMLGDYRDRL